jgi:hypothetical protein
MSADLDIPPFLRIAQANRKAAWRVFVPRPSHTTTSIERWRSYERQRQEEQARKTQARIMSLRAAKGLDPFYGSK